MVYSGVMPRTLKNVHIGAQLSEASMVVGKVIGIQMRTCQHLQSLTSETVSDGQLSSNDITLLDIAREEPDAISI